MIVSHLPIIQVVIPLLAAPICIVMHRPFLAWITALTAAWVTFAVADWLLINVLSAETPILYSLGGWAAPWGIEYRVDTINALILLIVSGVSAIVLPYSLASVRQEIPLRQHHLFYAALMLCLCGLLGMAITGDIFNAFVFLEISSLASYALISMGASRRALTAAFRYLILGTIGATFILLGIGLLYMVTGTLNMEDLANRLPEAVASRTVFVAIAFLAVGLSLKLALFPLHLWLASAYAYAPSVVSAFLSGTATKVAAYLFLRFTFGLFGQAYSLSELSLESILTPLALIAMLLGAIGAILQTNIKRMLAYSSISQIGYIVLGFGMASQAGITASMLHLFNHALMKTALFLAAGNIIFKTGTVNLDALSGIGKRMPITMSAFLLSGLSLVGIPGTVGFISKWYFLLAAIEQARWLTVSVIIFSSLLGAVYIWRVAEIAFFRTATEPYSIKEPTSSMLIPTCVLAGSCIYFGLETSLTVSLARLAASNIISVEP